MEDIATIAINGSTGQLGRLAIRHLKTFVDPANIVALVCDKAKAADLGVQSRVFDNTAPAGHAGRLGRRQCAGADLG